MHQTQIGQPRGCPGYCGWTYPAPMRQLRTGRKMDAREMAQDFMVQGRQLGGAARAHSISHKPELPGGPVLRPTRASCPVPDPRFIV